MSQSSDQFKVGDRVVFDPDGNYMDFGIVTRIEGDDIWSFWDNDKREMHSSSESIILESIYNSPLYQALR